MTNVVVTDITGSVMTIRMNRPEKRNALNRAAYSAIADELDAAAADPAIRVVVLTGAGGHFTSGSDIADFQAGDTSSGERPVSRFLRIISTYPKPIIAAVSGVAVGVGTTMLLHCDIVYADETARLVLPFVNLGLVPEAASSLTLPKVVGMARASEMLMFGEPLSAADAERYGIINRVVPKGELDAFVADRAARLARQPAGAVRQTKQLLRYAKTATVPERMAEEGALFAAALTSPESQEAMRAFMEKRTPDFSRFA